MAATRKKRRGSEPSEAGEPRRSKVRPAVGRLDETFGEWRFEPKATPRAITAVVLLSLGGVALGAGVYGEWFRGAELGVSPYALWLMLAGALMLGGYYLLGRDMPEVVRVGDLGVGIERSRSDVDRTAWYEVRGLELGAGLLTVELGGRKLTLSVAEHAPAMRRLLAEARERIPNQVRASRQERRRLGEPAPAEGEPMQAEAPQVAGLHCMSSGKELTFEHDTRRCARCGALYDKTAVPSRCSGCDATLRG
jgi:hypothetical protein